MYSDEELNSAVNAGVISQDMAAAFRAHVTELRQTPRVDEESFRLITGFNDIFVVIALCLLLTALSWIGGSWHAWTGSLAVAVASWMLVEYFTRKRRMALPSIMLLLSFVLSSAFLCFDLLRDRPDEMVWAGVAAAIAAYAHWRRFRVPVTVAAGTGAVAMTAIGSFFEYFPEAKEWGAVLIFTAGIFVFMLAMYWDGSDRQRSTSRSDVAFWLHLLAASLIVHSTFSFLGVLNRGDATPTQTLIVVAVYLVLALVSLAVDRRALMVSALVYVLYTFTSFLQLYGLVGMGFAITALVVGTLLLLLSAFWHAARACVIAKLPASWHVYLPVLQTSPAPDELERTEAPGGKPA